MSNQQIERVEDVPLSALQVMNRAEIDVAISTAKQYPRDVALAIRSTRAMVTMDPDTAASMYYSLPRFDKKTGKKKPIEGPTVRFAECLAHSWGNINIGGRITEEQEKYVVAQGVAHDLQSNVRIVMEFRSKIVDKEGRRFNDDMVGVTGNAAAAKALRSSTLRAIPKPLWWPLYQEARARAIGKEVDAETGEASTLQADELAENRTKAIEYLERVWKLELDNILAMTKRKSVEEIDEEDLAMLRGLATALKDGDITPQEAITGAKPIPKVPQRKPEAERRAQAKSRTAPSRAAEKKPAATTANRQPPAKSRVITAEQGIELFRIADKRIRTENIRGQDMEQKLIRAAIGKFGFEKTAQITTDKYAAVCEAVRTMKMAGK